MTGEISSTSQNRKVFTIVATGDSAKDWTPAGYSIGVNDSWKWGKPTDGLLICNRPQQFSQNRLEIIKSSKPGHFYSDSSDWKEWFNYFKTGSSKRRLFTNNPDFKTTRLLPWSGTLYPDTVFFSNSSPIIAITLAYCLGAEDIIIWGVDFRTHHLFNDHNAGTRREVEAYLEVFAALKEKGVSVYRGAKGSVFDDKLPLYGKQVDVMMTGHFDNYLNK
jgi:hypothetical protein